MRGQLDALRLVLALPRPPPGLLDLWLTSRDLFTPALTHGVGLAPVGGGVGLVSLARLPAGAADAGGAGTVAGGPLVVEVAHELGHAAGLVHCVVPRCPMRPVLAVEQLDLRRPDYCPACLDELSALLAQPAPG
jgi:archaemetzincin